MKEFSSSDVLDNWDYLLESCSQYQLKGYPRELYIYVYDKPLKEGNKELLQIIKSDGEKCFIIDKDCEEVFGIVNSFLGEEYKRYTNPKESLNDEERRILFCKK